MPTIISIVLILVSLAACLITCGLFAGVAADKGYSFGKYFAICFFFGAIGCAWVAALPDQGLLNELNDLRRKVSTLKYSPVDPASSAAHQWVCSACNAVNNMNHGQCKKCGRYR